MKAVQGTASVIIRKLGQSLDSFGSCLEVNPTVEKLLPSLRNVSVKGSVPSIAASFVAPSAVIAGKVTVGANSAVWYGAVVRGALSIGENSSIGELSVVTGNKKDTVIGRNVTVGSGAWVQDSTVEDNSVIGAGVKVHNAHIEANAYVTAGSVVEGQKVGAGQLWSGAPAAYIRNLTTAEVETLRTSLKETLELATSHAGENAKSWERIELDEFEAQQASNRSPEYYQPMSKEFMSKLAGEVEGHAVPGRIFDHPVSARSSANL